MSLADALASPAAASSDRCPVADLLASLPESEAAALVPHLGPRRMGIPSLRAILMAEGYYVGHTALCRHRAALTIQAGMTTTVRPCACR